MRPGSWWKRRACTELAASKGALAVERAAVVRRGQGRALTRLTAPRAALDVGRTSTRRGWLGRRGATPGPADLCARALRIERTRARSERGGARALCLRHRRCSIRSFGAEPLALIVVKTSRQGDEKEDRDAHVRERAAHVPSRRRVISRAKSGRVTTRRARSVNQQLQRNFVLRPAQRVISSNAILLPSGLAKYIAISTSGCEPATHCAAMRRSSFCCLMISSGVSKR